MATERNDNQLSGRYLIQDQDHMSGVSQGTTKSTRGAARQAEQSSARQQRAKRAHSAR